MGYFSNIQWKWEDMCGPGGLQPWNETSKDFGICFQQTFLQVPLYFLLAVVSAYFVGYRKDWVTREKAQERAIVLRSFVVLSLAFIPVIKLYTLITSVEYILYPVDYMDAGAGCLSWLVHFGYVLALKHRLGASARGPLGLLVLWTTSAVLTAILLRSRIIAGVPSAFDIATIVCHGLYLVSLVPSSHSRPTFYSPCLVGSQHLDHNEYTPLLPHMDEGVLGTAMQDAGCFSRLIFSWVEPLFKKGLDNKLKDADELFELPERWRCAYVGARLDRALIGNVDRHQQFEEAPHEPFISSGYGAMGESPTSRRVLARPARRQNVSLLRALHACFALQFYSIGVLKFVADTAGFAGPMLLNRLVVFVEDDTVDLHYGYLYAGGLFASTLIGALFNTHFNWLMSIVGIKMKGAILSAILHKLLSVTATDISKSFSEGEIMNFMSTDTDRIVNSCPSFHALWSIPLQLFVTLFLMYQQVGLSFLAGVGFAVLLIPVNKCVANKIGELSTDMMRHKDTRVSLVSDMLRGIRTVKVHVWEDYFINKIDEARAAECAALRRRKWLDAVCVVLWAATPALLAALTLAAHAARGGDLAPHTVFTTVALINMLISPLNAFPWVLNGLTEAWVSIKRIQKLLELSDMDFDSYYDRLNTNRDEDAVLIAKNASFAWTKVIAKKVAPKRYKGKGRSKKKLSKLHIQKSDSGSSLDVGAPEQPFMLKELDFEIRRGQLVGVGGPVGSGKSSLLHAIIANMEKRGGEFQIPDNLDGFGYVPQKPWLVRGTIRENILFGKPYDEARFKAVVDACALTEDLNVLGWNATVGSGGCTLSGGQRSRIALARAVYHEKQVYLLDDVLSAVDAAVARHIFRRCVLGLLRRATRVVVTHSPHLIARADLVLLMKDGHIARQGPPDTVLNEIDDFLPSEEPFDEEEPMKPIEKSDEDNLDTISRSSMDVEETMSEGSVSWRVLAMYLRSAGWAVSVAILLSLILMQLSQNLTFLWLSFWVENRRNTTGLAIGSHAVEKTSLMDHGFIAMDNAIHSIFNTTMRLVHLMEGANASSYERDAERTQATSSPVQLSTVSPQDMFYMEIYFGLAGVNLLFTIMRAFLFAYGGVVAAKRIHKSLLRVVVKAKVKFFDVTPTGRILNRFSSDTYTVDDTLPFILNILLAQFFSLIGALAVTAYGLPWVCAALLPLVPVYYWLQRRYRVLSRHLKRLQSVTLSPVYTHFSDTLEGSATLRALGAGAARAWGGAGAERAEAWQRAGAGAAAAAAWLALRLQALAVLLCAAAALAAVLQRQLHVASAGLVGLAISYALTMASTVGGVMSAFTETEREMIAVERVAEYINNIECEKIDGDPPPYGWPSQGVIYFEDVVLKYSSRDTTSPALNKISFSTYPGEKLGVVGRTGAGKSSLLLAILRLADISEGVLLVDGVPVSSLNLHALRSRIGVIPQEPFIFGGSVRDNVDPLRQHSEAELRRALERCGARALGAGLGAAAAGLSRGNRQLLCLARALLQRPKILLIDEATANVDHETELTILETLLGAFAGSTILMVAHRVSTVLQCSRVLVMSGGQLVEHNAPAVLLDSPGSLLYAMVHAHDARPAPADGDGSIVI